MGYDLRVVKVGRDQIVSKVKIDASGCWLWLGSMDAKGYGVVVRRPFGSKGKVLQIKAHRASWLAFNGPDGMETLCVLHKCDNPRCVNPDHLFLGSKTDNARDRDTKGRCKLWRGKPSRPDTFRIGY